jgi:TolA-binding protein
VVALVALREPAPELGSRPQESPARAVEVPAPAPIEPVQPETPRELVNEVAPAPQEKQGDETAPAPRKAVKASSVSELRDEIRLMDQARAALRAGSADKALALLARYAQRYPEGAFRQEATVLQLEALERAGQRSKASSLARKFLDEHPESPHVERVGRAVGDK